MVQKGMLLLQVDSLHQLEDGLAQQLYTYICDMYQKKGFKLSLQQLSTSLQQLLSSLGLQPKLLS